MFSFKEKTCSADTVIDVPSKNVEGWVLPEMPSKTETKTFNLNLIKTGAPNVNFRKISVRLRSRIFGTFVVKFLACLPLLGFSNI